MGRVPKRGLGDENGTKCFILLLYVNEMAKITQIRDTLSHLSHISLTFLSHLSLSLASLSHHRFGSPLRRDIPWKISSIATKTMNMSSPFQSGSNVGDFFHLHHPPVCTFACAISRYGWLLPGGTYKANGFLQMPDRRQVFSRNSSAGSLL